MATKIFALMSLREDRRAILSACNDDRSDIGALDPPRSARKTPFFMLQAAVGPSPTLLKLHLGARISRVQVYAAKDGYQNGFSRDGLGHHEPVRIFVLRELGLPSLVSPYNLHRVQLPLLRRELPPSHSIALLLEEWEMAVTMVPPAREGSIRAEDDHPSPCVLNPAAAWVRNVPLPTLVAYRENVS